jgi:hypothetical protein
VRTVLAAVAENPAGMVGTQTGYPPNTRGTRDFPPITRRTRRPPKPNTRGIRDYTHITRRIRRPPKLNTRGTSGLPAHHAQNTQATRLSRTDYTGYPAITRHAGHPLTTRRITFSILLNRWPLILGSRIAKYKCTLF